MGEYSGIKVEPNPAVEGGNVTISGSPNDVVYVVVFGTGGKQTRKKIKLDGNGKAVEPVPVGAGQEFMVSDLKFPDASGVFVDVVSQLVCE